jgi:hypothetical protein
MQLNGSDEGKGIVNSKALGDERLESSTSDEIRHNAPPKSQGMPSLNPSPVHCAQGQRMKRGSEGIRPMTSTLGVCACIGVVLLRPFSPPMSQLQQRTGKGRE